MSHTRRRQPERAIQVALIEHLTWRAAPGTWFSHFPAGGRRNVVDGVILKAMGVRAGTPDLLLVNSGKLWALELKSERGRLSDIQRQCHEDLRAAGATVGTAGSLDQAIDLLGEWGLLK